MRLRRWVLGPGSVLLASAFRPPPAAADLTVLRETRQETTTFAERTLKYAFTEQVRIQPEKVRITNVTLGRALIVRLDQKKVIHLDLLQGTRSVLTFQQLAARRQAALEDVRGARERVQDTPEAARLAGVLSGFGVFLDGPPKVDRAATAEKESIAGREAARVKITVGGEPRFDLWVAEGPEEARWYYEALGALQAFPAEAAEALRRCGGFPLREDARYALFLDRVRVRAEATSIDAGPIPPSEFEAPDDFRSVPFEALPEDPAPDPPPPSQPPPAPPPAEKAKDKP